jgi:hypothetical protein
LLLQEEAVAEQDMLVEAVLVGFYQELLHYSVEALTPL